MAEDIREAIKSLESAKGRINPRYGIRQSLTDMTGRLRKYATVLEDGKLMWDYTKENPDVIRLDRRVAEVALYAADHFEYNAFRNRDWAENIDEIVRGLIAEKVEGEVLDSMKYKELLSTGIPSEHKVINIGATFDDILDSQRRKSTPIPNHLLIPWTEIQFRGYFLVPDKSSEGFRELVKQYSPHTALRPKSLIKRGIIEKRVIPVSTHTEFYEYRFRRKGVKALEKLLASN